MILNSYIQYTWDITKHIPNKYIQIPKNQSVAIKYYYLIILSKYTLGCTLYICIITNFCIVYTNLSCSDTCIYLRQQTYIR